MTIVVITVILAVAVAALVLERRLTQAIGRLRAELLMRHCPLAASGTAMRRTDDTVRGHEQVLIDQGNRLALLEAKVRDPEERRRSEQMTRIRRAPSVESMGGNL